MRLILWVYMQPVQVCGGPVQPMTDVWCRLSSSLGRFTSWMSGCRFAWFACWSVAQVAAVDGRRFLVLLIRVGLCGLHIGVGHLTKSVGLACGPTRCWISRAVLDWVTCLAIGRQLLLTLHQAVPNSEWAKHRKVSCWLTAL